MSNEIQNNIAKAIVFLSFVVSISLVASAVIIKQDNSNNRYSFSLATTLDNEHWITVGDTRTGKSWTCTSKHNFEGFKGEEHLYLPNDFNGCMEMVSPVEASK